MKTTLSLLAAIALAIFAAPARADYVVQSFTGGSAFNIFYGGSTGDVVGFRFTADETGFITELGVLNDPLDGVLNSPHMVGIWDAAQVLLGFATVDSSSNLVNGFYYEPVAPIPIVAGQQYTLGAMYTATDGDSYISSPTTVTLMHISNTNGVFPPTGNLGFVFPTSDSTNLARFGPNAFFTTTIIPEPSSGMLLLVGCAVFCIRRRRA